jgi:hypothetical protein
MRKRLTVILPDVKLAVLHHTRTRSKQSLRVQLRREALANAARDLESAQEWFPLEAEAWRTAGRKKDHA